MYKWDWYQTTSHMAIDDVIKAFKHTSLNDLTDFRSCTPHNGYAHAAEFVRGDQTICRVMWGGNPGVNILGTGSHAPAVAEAVRVALPGHLPTRVDACIDLAAPSIFDHLAAAMLAFAVDHSIKIDQRGDWARGRARTLYLGSSSSPAMVRMYEKGCQMLDVYGDTSADQDWTRVEVVIKPKRHARSLVAGWSPEDAFTRGSPWLSKLWEAIGWGTYTPYSIGTVRNDSDVIRQRRALARQFGRILEQWIVDSSSPAAFVEDFRQVRRLLAEV